MVKTREFQTQLLHYFSKSDNKSNHHQTSLAAAEKRPSGSWFNAPASTALRHIPVSIDIGKRLIHRDLSKDEQTPRLERRPDEVG